MITPQSIFNAAWQRFIVEGRLPCIKDQKCAYSHNGNNCAVGAVMTEEQIQKITEEGLDDNVVDDIIAVYPEWFAGNVNIIPDLQVALHDKLADVSSGKWIVDKETLEQRYKEIAQEYGLEIPSKKE